MSFLCDGSFNSQVIREIFVNRSLRKVNAVFELRHRGTDAGCSGGATQDFQASDFKNIFSGVDDKPEEYSLG